MEPILMVSAFVLLVGGDKLLNDDSGEDIVASEQIIEEQLDNAVTREGFGRGSFMWSEDGYYISNLTPEPIQPEGCDKPLYLADLSEPRTRQSLPVEFISLGCGG